MRQIVGAKIEVVSEQVALSVVRVSVRPETNVYLFQEPLSLEEQGGLLKNVNVVIGNPQGFPSFYLWWSLFLGTPVCFESTPNWYYPTLTPTLLMPFIYPDLTAGLLSFHMNFVQKKQHVLEVQQKIQEYYETKALPCLYNTLWSLRLELPLPPLTKRG